MEVVQFEGLEITLARQALMRDERWSSSMPAGLWCGVLAQGTVSTSREGINNTWQPETLIKYWVENPVEVEHLIPEECKLGAMFIRVLPDHVEALLGADQVRAASSPNAMSVSSHHRIANSLAWQILTCSLTGASRRLYISSKALEVLSVVSAEPMTGRDRMRPAKAQEAERVRYAHDLLMEALSDPPTVPELARIVGMNAHRLSELFKDAFGTSVYSYVKAARLDRARFLLLTAQTTIAASGA